MPDRKTAESMEPTSDEKLLAAIGYLGILCLVPLLLKKESAFCQFHGKQGLVVLVGWIVLWAGNIVPVIGTLVWLFGSLALFCLAVLGAIHAFNGKEWEMPVLGGFAKGIKL